jgi:hypothetical protein
MLARNGMVLYPCHSWTFFTTKWTKCVFIRCTINSLMSLRVSVLCERGSLNPEALRLPGSEVHSNPKDRGSRNDIWFKGLLTDTEMDEMIRNARKNTGIYFAYFRLYFVVISFTTETARG